jgi:hypothetical protein
MLSIHKPVCIVMCSAQKAEIPSSSAAELYRSQRFEDDRRAITERGYDWCILSGRYGLVQPKQVLDAYDVDLDRAPYLKLLIWRLRVLFQLARRLGFRSACVVCLSARGSYLESTELTLQVLGFRRRNGLSFGLPERFQQWIRE